MKSNSKITPRQATLAENGLYRAMLTLETVEEARDFFHDLCTPAELEAMTDRWSVVAPLVEGRSYRDISDKTGVSVTTVGRVARFLTQGNGGYQRVLQRLGLHMQGSD